MLSFPKNIKILNRILEGGKDHFSFAEPKYHNMNIPLVVFKGNSLQKIPDYRQISELQQNNNLSALHKKEVKLLVSLRQTLTSFHQERLKRL